ncbi:MAG: hypothetical protein DMF79_02185 [Acidobacteria bacterium]|nr:MAG: hypothetical protein DMF79_02185 [Acidobacteriota bacterium]
MRDRAVFVVLLLVVAFYFWTASNGKPFGVGQPQGEESFYNVLADALRHGQLHLRLEPRPEMFELMEPYEPARNDPFRLHDASLYKGKYYLYFGVVPAFLLFVPWQLVAGDLPENLGAAILGAAALFVWGLALRRMIRTHLPGTPLWMEAGALLTLGLANVMPFLMRGAVVYEVAIAAGTLFLGAAVWFLLTAGEGGRPLATGLALGGLCLGLAVGCRPNHVLVAPFVLVLAGPAVLAPSHAGGPGATERRGRAALALLAPLLAVGLLLGLYNHARFGSWTQFGTPYQLGGMRPVPWFDPRAVPTAFYFHFLAPPVFKLDFPFLLPHGAYPGTTPEGFFTDSSTTGFLVHAPLVLILLFAGRLLRGAPVEDAARLRFRILALAAAGLALPLLTSLVFAAAAMRYEAEFAGFLILPALLLWIAADQSTRGRRRVAVRAAAFLVLGWSALAGVALSFSGNMDVLRLHNPALFAALAGRFEPLRVALGRLLASDQRALVRMRVAFPERLVGEAEPLLSSGDKEAHDVLWVRQLGPGTFAFDLAPVAGPRLSTRPLPLEPGRFYDFAVELDHVRRTVAVRVDGAEAFAFSARIGPVHRNRIWVSRGPKGSGAVSLGRFSGTIVTDTMMLAGRPGLESLPRIEALPALYTESAQAAPAGAVPGQLWAPAGKDGAYLFTGTEWRWVPRYFLDRVQVDRRVTFGNAPPGSTEPLLTWGAGQRLDAVYVRPVGPGRVAFGLARWSGAWELGVPGSPVATRALQDVRVTVDRVAGQVTVALGGREALRARADLAPILRSAILVGQSPPALSLGRGAFSGRIEP